MRNWIAAVAGAFVSCGYAPVASAAWLCIPEASATVIDSGTSFQSGALETSNKFILSAENGGLSVKLHPSGYVAFSNCPTEFFCDGSPYFTGAFMRSIDTSGRQVFTAFWMTAAGSSKHANSAKGYCTEI